MKSHQCFGTACSQGNKGYIFQQPSQKIRRGDHPVQEEIDYIPRVRKVLSLALDEAERQGSAYVRTEHILLGLVRDGGGVGADILDAHGVLGKVRTQVFELLG